MAQMTWRMSDEVLERVRHQARAHGRSLNDWVSTVMDAVSDPAAAGTEAARLRERLARAGILSTSTLGPQVRPDPDRVVEARAAAGHGTPLSDLVADGRR